MLFGGVDGRNFTLFIVLGGEVAARELVRVFRVLTERVGKVVRSHTLLRHRVLLLQHQLLLFDLSEPGVFQRLRGRNSIIRIVHQQFDDQVLHFGRRVRNQLVDACAFSRRKVELHVSRILLEFLQKTVFGGTQNVVNLVYLI